MKYLAVCFVFLFSSCSYVNEGTVDFRRTGKDFVEYTTPADLVREQLLIDKEGLARVEKEISREARESLEPLLGSQFCACDDLQGLKDEMTKKGKTPDWVDASRKKLVDIFTEAKRPLQVLQVKNFTTSEGGKNLFKKGDYLSIHLRTAFVKYFSENHFSAYTDDIFTRKFADVTGEIAIIANAFEERNGKELSFSDMRAGRVVFYSEDVEQGQRLNFNNMPIYGPLEYAGYPVALRLSIFELDVISSQSKAMLSAVAQAGAKAYPPSSPALELLNSLGDTFFGSDQTDTEFRYAMILDPKGGSDAVNHFSLEAGNYVFIRQEDRKKTESNIPWDALRLDENEGVLYKMVDGKPELYVDETYLVVEINKNVSSVSVQLAENNYGDLIAALEKADASNSDNLNNTVEALTRVAHKRDTIKNFSQAKEYLGVLKDGQSADYQKKMASQKLYGMISDSYKADAAAPSGFALKEVSLANTDEPELLQEQIDYLLGELMEQAYQLNWDVLGSLEKFNGSHIAKAFKQGDIQNMANRSELMKFVTQKNSAQ